MHAKPLSRLAVQTLAISVLACFDAPDLRAQEPSLTSQQALAELGTRVGESALSRLVMMKGFDGAPQPSEWEIITHDPRDPLLLHRYRAGVGYVRDEGEPEGYYPAREPSGFIDYAQLRLDSQGAFTIAEAAARQARMGFDSLTFELRCREYSREPVWILDLVDADGFLVGRVHISANTAKVFRTVWIYRDNLINGLPRIVDSALTPDDQLSSAPPLDDGGAPVPLPGGTDGREPPRSIQIDPDATFVPPAPAPPAPETGPPPMERKLERESGSTIAPELPAGSTSLPPIPPELLQAPDIPDTTIPPSPVSGDGD